MPFQADIRCNQIRVELNISMVQEYIEDITERELDPDYDLYLYVEELENELSGYINNRGLSSFGEWFYDNYNDIERWVEVENNLRLPDGYIECDECKESFLEDDELEEGEEVVSYICEYCSKE